MKRSVIGVVILAVTFFVGYLLVPNFGADLAREVNIEIVEILKEAQPTEHPEAKRTPFIPEFRDLPNFEDIEIPEFNTKLVDVFESDGVYRESEVIAKSGENWLGLLEQNGKLSLKTIKVSVTTAPPNRGYADEKSVQFGFSQRIRPVFIVKNSTSLKPGHVTSVYHRPYLKDVDTTNFPAKSMEIGYSETFRLNGKEYTLRVAPGITRDGSEANVLVLEYGGKSQIVTSNSHFHDQNTKYDSIGNLLWVGDLDRDGKLDLYFSDFDYEKGGFGSNLFLSSEAETGEFVKQIAGFGTSGC